MKTAVPRFPGSSGPLEIQQNLHYYIKQRQIPEARYSYATRNTSSMVVRPEKIF